MDLWIRSQDRESIFKVKSVFHSITEKNEHLIRTIVIDNVNNGIVKLGQYSTKERALEVLDEIQKLLMPQINIIHNKIDQRTLQDIKSGVITQPVIKDIQIQQANSYVYEMPID